MVGRSLARQLGKALFGDGERAPQAPRTPANQLLANVLPAESSTPEVISQAPASSMPPDAEKARSPEPTGTFADDESGAARVRVLAAEDNPTNRQVLELLLSMIDAEVTFGVNGAEAV